MRRTGAILVLGLAALTAVAAVGFIAQGTPRDGPPPASAVARLDEVSGTPLSAQVLFQRGSDRRMQRQASRFACGPNVMGCETEQLRPVPVFVVRDDLGTLRAFIAEDPRNGCALEWLTLPQPMTGLEHERVDAVFHDRCHGSLYDRRGRRIGGPSPFDLNALATEIRGGDVYVDPGKILVGACSGCDR